MPSDPRRTFQFLLVINSNYGAISHRYRDLGRWPWSDLSRSPKVILIMPSDFRSPHDMLIVFIVTIALSRPETLFLADDLYLTFQGHQKVKLNMPPDVRPITYDWCSIVTKALSRTEKLFFSIWSWSDVSRSPKVELIIPFYSRPMTSYLSSIVIIALSRTETLFFSRWPWSDLSRSPEVKLITSSDQRLMTSHQRSIVTIPLSRFVYEIFVVKLLKHLTFLRSNWSCHPIRDLWLIIIVP